MGALKLDALGRDEANVRERTVEVRLSVSCIMRLWSNRVHSCVTNHSVCMAGEEDFEVCSRCNPYLSSSNPE